MFCPIKKNSITIELAVPAPCYCVLDLLWVTIYVGWVFFFQSNLLPSYLLCLQGDENPKY